MCMAVVVWLARHLNGGRTLNSIIVEQCFPNSLHTRRDLTLSENDSYTVAYTKHTWRHLRAFLLQEEQFVADAVAQHRRCRALHMNRPNRANKTAVVRQNRPERKYQTWTHAAAPVVSGRAYAFCTCGAHSCLDGIGECVRGASASRTQTEKLCRPRTTAVVVVAVDGGRYSRFSSVLSLY